MSWIRSQEPGRFAQKRFKRRRDVQAQEQHESHEQHDWSASADAVAVAVGFLLCCTDALNDSQDCGAHAHEYDAEQEEENAGGDETAASDRGTHDGEFAYERPK